DDASGFADIFVKLVGDGDPVRLTTDPAPDFAPAWSPDGRRLAFVRWPFDASMPDIVVMPALRGTQRHVASLLVAVPLLDHPGTNLLSWTPDSRWLSVGAEIDGQRGLWLVEVDGPGRRRLTQPTAGQFDRSPVVSADGTRVAFIRVGPNTRSDLLVQALGPDFTPRGEPRLVKDAWPSLVTSVAWGADQASLVLGVGASMGMSRLEHLQLLPDRLTPAGPSDVLPFGDQATGLDVAPSGRVVYVRR